MYVRLGFSMAITVEPDILLVDEVLAVGDASFQQRCLEKFADLRTSGRTVVIVSHSPRHRSHDVRQRGVVRPRKPPEGGKRARRRDRLPRVGTRRPARPQHAAEAQSAETDATPGWGIDEVQLLDDAGHPIDILRTGSPVTIRVAVDAPAAAPVALAISIYRTDGVHVAGPIHPFSTSGSGRHVVDYRVARFALAGGAYDVSVALLDQHLQRTHTARHRAARLDVTPGDDGDNRWRGGAGRFVARLSGLGVTGNTGVKSIQERARGRAVATEGRSVARHGATEPGRPGRSSSPSGRWERWPASCSWRRSRRGPWRWPSRAITTDGWRLVSASSHGRRRRGGQWSWPCPATDPIRPRGARAARSGRRSPAPSSSCPGFTTRTADKDPGIYVAHGFAIAREGDVYIDDPVLERGLNTDLFRGSRFPGIWIEPDHPNQVTPQFFHLYSSLLATADDLGGRGGHCSPCTPLARAASSVSSHAPRGARHRRRRRRRCSPRHVDDAGVAGEVPLDGDPRPAASVRRAPRRSPGHRSAMGRRGVRRGCPARNRLPRATRRFPLRPGRGRGRWRSARPQARFDRAAAALGVGLAMTFPYRRPCERLRAANEL